VSLVERVPRNLGDKLLYSIRNYSMAAGVYRNQHFELLRHRTKKCGILFGELANEKLQKKWPCLVSSYLLVFQREHVESRRMTMFESFTKMLYITFKFGLKLNSDNDISKEDA
jgi:hypothetical protein